MIKIENMYTLLAIDAWNYDDGWTWNQWFEIEKDIYLEEPVTARSLFKFMRRNGWLTQESKGKIALENDGYNWVILDKNTHEPLLAFEPQWDI